MNVLLRPISRNGKNKIDNVLRAAPEWDGKTWHVVEQSDRVGFSNIHGGWLFVCPRHTGCADASRWVNLHADKDFHVEETNQ
jgi:hypothetical protein